MYQAKEIEFGAEDHVVGYVPMGTIVEVTDYHTGIVIRCCDTWDEAVVLIKQLNKMDDEASEEYNQ